MSVSPQHRPPVDAPTVGVVALAVVAVSSSGPLVAFAAAPALAIAFWRNLLSVGVLGPFALARRRAEFRALTVGVGRREGWYCVLSGVALAAHFATWMPSVRLTSVAAATALVATQPVWQGLIARGQGRRLPAAVWAGIGVSVGGAALASGADLGVSGPAFAGDLLALAGGMFAAVYTALGERARRAVSTTTYTTVCYGVCALVLLTVGRPDRLGLARPAPPGHRAARARATAGGRRRGGARRGACRPPGRPHSAAGRRGPAHRASAGLTPRTFRGECRDSARPGAPLRRQCEGRGAVGWAKAVGRGLSSPRRRSSRRWGRRNWGRCGGSGNGGR